MNILRFSSKITDTATIEKAGGKGFNLLLLSRLLAENNINAKVPEGFVIPVDFCQAYYESGRKVPPNLMQEVLDGLRWLEEATGLRLGNQDCPLLLSARSGARISMAGMMDTMLFVGITIAIVLQQIKLGGDAIMWWDSLRRYIVGRCTIIFEMKPEIFSNSQAAIVGNQPMTGDLMKAVAMDHLRIMEEAGHAMPTPENQVLEAVIGVFESWEIPRAKKFRKEKNIPENWYTACTIQRMVFGNGVGPGFGTGVFYSRDTDSGLFNSENNRGSWMPNASGSDIVDGSRNAFPIFAAEGGGSFQQLMPEHHETMVQVGQLLERERGWAREKEYTVAYNALYLLQDRDAKLTLEGIIRTAVDLAQRGIISWEDAILRIPAGELETIGRTYIANADLPLDRILATGIAGVAGVATGEAFFDSREIEDIGEKDPSRSIILLRPDTGADDVGAIFKSAGAGANLGTGGAHLIVTVRAEGKPAAVGFGCLEFDPNWQYCLVRKKDGTTVRINKGDIVTIDGARRLLILGSVVISKQDPPEELNELLAQARKRMGGKEVYLNGDSAEEAEEGFKQGATGIGLYRGEGPLMSGKAKGVELAMAATQAAMLLHDGDSRLLAILQILEDFYTRELTAINLIAARYASAAGLDTSYPITVRFIEYPWDEVAPRDLAGAAGAAQLLGISPQEVLDRFAAKIEDEPNPNMGERGVRLYNNGRLEYLRAQTRAIVRAAHNAAMESGLVIPANVMMAMVSFPGEAEYLAPIIIAEAERLLAELGKSDRVLLVTDAMTETAANDIIDGSVAEVVDNISNGTNDKTSSRHLICRQGFGSFLDAYIRIGILKVSPFDTLTDTVVRGMKQGAEAARTTWAKRGHRGKVKICGEQGGDPDSIAKIFDFVDVFSCSRKRITTAIIAVAQEHIKRQRAA